MTLGETWVDTEPQGATLVTPGSDSTSGRHSVFSAAPSSL